MVITNPTVLTVCKNNMICIVNGTMCFYNQIIWSTQVAGNIITISFDNYSTIRLCCCILIIYFINIGCNNKA